MFKPANKAQESETLVRLVPVDPPTPTTYVRVINKNTGNFVLIPIGEMCQKIPEGEPLPKEETGVFEIFPEAKSTS